MSLKVRKLAIQVADIVDFGVASGVSRLVAGTGITLSPVSGIGAVTVSSVGVGLDGIPPVVDASGQAAGTGGTASRSDHKHQLANPITGTVVITPSTSLVPLTLKGFATGTADLLDIFDSTSPTQVLRWQWLSSAILQYLSPGATTDAIRLFVSGEANFRFGIRTDGLLAWGPGGGALFDSTIQRLASAFLQTNSQIEFQSGLATTVALDTLLTADTESRFILRIGSIMEWGPGGLTATDTKLERTGAGVMRFAVLAPPAVTMSLGLLGGEPGAAERRLRENAGVLEVTDTTPSVLFRIGSNWVDLAAIATPAAPALNVRRVFVVSTRNLVSAETSAGTVVYLEGRGAPNVAVAKAATSLAVTLSPAEPDTSYEIGTTLAFNSTAFYSAKATTGFTINFGTAPAAASTLDWTVDRRVSGSA